MAVDLICPDCGGVIGGKGVDSDGRSPCTCSRDDSSAGSEDPSSDTVSIPAMPGSKPSAVNAAPAAAPQKPCILCGKETVGHRRVKDSRGYMCYECAKAEVAAEKAGTIPCAWCKRRVKPAGLVEVDGKRICKKCYNDHKERERLEKKVVTHEYEKTEKQSVIILGVVFGVLALILLIHFVSTLFHH